MLFIVTVSNQNLLNLKDETLNRKNERRQTMESDFAKRLIQACDDNPLIPDYGHGRQVTIAEKLDVSQEAVRKWFNRESVPRAKKMKLLAEYLGVSEQWLALGVKPTLDRTAQREMTRVTKGAVHMLAGLIALEGGNFAFPSPDDARSKFVDLYVIKDGFKTDFHVSVGRRLGETNAYEFMIPREFNEVHILGLVYLPGGEIEWINMPKGAIDKNKEAADGIYRIIAERDSGKYSSGSDKWSNIRKIGDVL
jgi:transcriptional regulator with XRE-family HTH domain